MNLGRVFANDSHDEQSKYGIGYGALVEPATFGRDHKYDCGPGEGCEQCGKFLTEKNCWLVTPVYDHNDYVILCSECASKEDR